MKRYFSLLVFGLLPVLAGAQPWNDPAIAGEGKYHPRTEFISFTTRQLADSGDPKQAVHYLSLNGRWDIENTATDTVAVAKYRAFVEIPYLWLDRDIFFHVEGTGAGHALFINDRKVGCSADSRTPAEYNISPYVKDGLNTARVEVYGYTAGSWLETALRPLPVGSGGSIGRTYIYSQPKLRIDDFTITARDSTDSRGNINGIIRLEAVVSNSYRTPETIEFWYDIFRPDGQRHMTNSFTVKIAGESTDTIRSFDWVYPSVKKLWTPETPNLYSIMMFVKRDGRNIEYIPFKVGFNDVVVRDGQLFMNRKQVELNVVCYNAAADGNAAADEAKTLKELQAFKKQKINTIQVGYPQPRWFYEMCDREGFYVIDQANINSDFRTDDRNVGGALANNPEFLNQYIDRVSYMKGRSKNYTSIIATSLGGNNGNGYNMYKAYQYMKAIDTLHPVIYHDVQGEWNSDLTIPEGAAAEDFLK